MTASDVAAFSLPAASGGAAAVATAAAAGLGLAVPGGIVLGGLSERLALRSSPLPLPSASKPTAQKAWGTAVRAATGAVAVRGMYLWSGMSAVDAAASAAALSGAGGNAGATTTVAKLGADALTAMLTFIVWTVCLATGAKIGSALQPVGITGGIACGKSTVSELLAAAKDEASKSTDKGDASTNIKTPFAIIDVDKIGHDILIPGKLIPSESAYDNVVKAFGTDILSTDAPTKDIIQSDGGDQTSHRIERRKLGDVIFRDPSKRKILNKLTHPLISKIMIKRVVTWNLFRRANSTKNKLVAVDIPLLFEVGLMMKLLFGLKVVVACKPSTQLERLMARNTDLTEEQCQNRIDSQMPVANKVKMADVVIWNDGDMNELKAEVEKARADICARVNGWGISLSKAVLILGASAVAKTVATALAT